MATARAPAQCGSRGLPLSRDELELALRMTDAWVARLVCQDFRDRCEPRNATRQSAVRTIERLELAFALGMGRLRVCEFAARGGHLEVLQWARANGCGWGISTCHEAARGGHLEVLQWARANGCAWNASTCCEAARGGHLATLQWARANGCCWDTSTCTHAAMRGHLEVLQWARANGCEWDLWTWVAAHPAVREWLAANGCPRE
jgi:hypothetical protein